MLNTILGLPAAVCAIFYAVSAIATVVRRPATVELPWFGYFCMSLALSLFMAGAAVEYFGAAQ